MNITSTTKYKFLLLCVYVQKYETLNIKIPLYKGVSVFYKLKVKMYKYSFTSQFKRKVCY